MTQQQVGERVRRRLVEMDRDQKWLAKQLRKDASTVSRWLSGERQMTVEQLHEIGLVLHRSEAWLLGQDAPADISDDLARSAALAG